MNIDNNVIRAVKQFGAAVFMLRKFQPSSLRHSTGFRRHLITISSKLPVCFGKQTSNVQRSFVKQFRREYRAAYRLFQSSFNSHRPCLRAEKLSRSLQTSSRLDCGRDDDDRNKKDDEKEKVKKFFGPQMMFFWVTFGLSAVAYALVNPSTRHEFSFISWNEFLHQMLTKGEVERIVVNPKSSVVMVYLYENAVSNGNRVIGKVFLMDVVNVLSFESKLRKAEASLGISPEDGVSVVYDRAQETASYMLIAMVAVAFIIIMMFRSGQIKMPNGIDIFSQLKRAHFTMVDPLSGSSRAGVRFKDVAGLKEAKVEINEFVDYLKRPEKYKMLGAKVPRGVLLLGPPGCGKTMLAKAVATEASVPFLAMNGSEFIEMIGGLGAARVRDLFKEARKRSPSIIYIDEIDAIGKKRGIGEFDSGPSEEDQTLNQLLVELDGMASTEGVIMLASTNRADILDKALLRPGRFDRHILIDFPTLIERKEIFEQHLKSISLERLPEAYSRRLAQLTPGFSGADIANVCNEAALHAARNTQVQVGSEDLEYAVERVVGGTEKRSLVMSPQERRVVAFHECGHALVGWLLKYTDALLKVSIVPRTTNVLGFSQYLPNDKKLYSQEELFERMCMALGGRVAESLIFNRVSTGAEDDLKRVTKMAYAQIQEYGMDETVGLLSFPSESEGERFVGKKPFSKRLANIIDQQARNLVAHAYQATEKILRENVDKLNLLAEKLLEKEVLNYDDVEALIGPSPYGKKKLVEMVDWDVGIDEKQNNNERPTSPL